MAAGLPDAIDRYEVLERIGHGGMGTLYRARDPRIGRDVAIKLLREELDDGETRERFAREARSAGQLKHGNIVTIFEFGDYNGQPFIAMEYIQGETLAAFLQRRPVLPMVRKLEIMDQLCAGLQYAHRMGVIHRDIKPANIMIDEEGAVKILDFGIARMGPSNMTQAGVLMGTLNYMAPEQMEGKLVDERADMFSAGAVFYEILAYRHAFPGDARGVMYKILHGSPEPLAEVCPGIDPGLVAIIDRCMAKEPDDRYPDLAVARRELAAVRRRLERDGSNEPDATIVGGQIGGAEGPSSNPPHTPRPSSRESSRSSKWVQIRTDQIQSHVNEARQAFQSGDYQATLSACGKALVLDPENAEASDLEERTRAALEQQVLTSAREDLERGALTSAAMLIDKVLSENPDSPEAVSIRQAVEAARARLAARQAEAQELERQRVAAERAEAEAERARAEAERQRSEQVETERARQAADAHARAQREFEERRTAASGATGDTIVMQYPSPAPAPASPNRRTPPASPTAASQRAATKGRSGPPIAVVLGGAAAALALIVVVGFYMRRNGGNPPIDVPRQEQPGPPSTEKATALTAPQTAPPATQPLPLETAPSTPATPTPPPIETAQATPTTAPAVVPPAPQGDRSETRTDQATPPIRAKPPVVDQQGRNASERQARDRDLADRYARAKSALDGGAFSTALTQLEALRRDDPGYRDVGSLIARAREEMGAAAKQSLEEGTKLEGAGDLKGALDKYERAAQIDPSMATIADGLAGKVKARMKAEATDALTRAKQYDAVDRVPDAIKWYEKAFSLLPDDDASKNTVKARLDLLRARK
jgi:serine/threonine-protein kinase